MTALQRRALRPAAVAIATWAGAGWATSTPDLAGLMVSMAVVAALCAAAFLRVRHPALGIAAVALACAAATGGSVTAAAPARAQIAALQVEGDRQLDVELTVVGHVAGASDGGAWFDAVASRVTAGTVTVTGGIPTRVGVDTGGRAEVAASGLGSVIRLTGRAVPPRPGERAILVLRAQEIIEAPPPEGIWAWFEALRDGLVASTRGLPQPGAGLVPGLAVGDTSSLDPATDAAMTASSLSHLTAVSGANCALVVGAAFVLLAAVGAPRALRVVGASVVLIGFVVLVTPEPSVVRAATMAAIALLALTLGRPAAGVAVLSAAVTVLIIADPWLSTSLGFALSAAATAALLVLAHPIARGLERWMPRALALALAVPTAAQLACGPLIVLIDPHVPLLGIVANLVADPAAAPATIAGVLACIAPFPWLRDGLSALAWVPASWIAAVAHTTSGIGAQNLPWPDGGFGAALLTLVSASMAVALIRPTLVRRVTALSTAIVAVTVGLIAGHTTLRTVAGPLTVPTTWDVAMCDVGQGDATLWRSGSAVALVDTGPEPEPLAQCLRTFGVDHLDLVVLTHFDLDHIGGSAAVVGRATLVVHGPVDVPEDQRLLDRFAAAGAELQQATTGTTGTVGETRWQALGPAPRDEPGNGASVALDVVGADFPRTVLLGDLGKDAQAALLRRVEVPRVDVVKISHHGSADQDPELYRRLHPLVGLIGVGADNRYGHPTATLLSTMTALGVVVGRTDTDGDLAVSMTDGQLTLWRARPPGSQVLASPARRPTRHRVEAPEATVEAGRSDMSQVRRVNTCALTRRDGGKSVGSHSPVTVRSVAEPFAEVLEACAHISAAPVEDPRKKRVDTTEAHAV